MGETEPRAPALAGAVYEVCVTEDHVRVWRLAGRATLRWIVEFSSVASMLFDTVPRHDVTIRVVRRDDGRVVCTYRCRHDDEALAIEHSLRDDLRRLTESEFLDELGLRRAVGRPSG